MIDAAGFPRRTNFPTRMVFPKAPPTRRVFRMRRTAARGPGVRCVARGWVGIRGRRLARRRPPRIAGPVPGRYGPRLRPTPLGRGRAGFGFPSPPFRPEAPGGAPPPRTPPKGNSRPRRTNLTCHPLAGDQVRRPGPSAGGFAAPLGFPPLLPPPAPPLSSPPPLSEAPLLRRLT